MRDYQNMKQSQAGDDPLSKEITIFKKKREQADMIEQVFRNIKNKYKSTDIGQMKSVIDDSLTQESPTYNKPAANSYLNKLRNELSSKAFQTPEFSKGNIINDFKATTGKPPSRTAYKIESDNRSPSPAPIIRVQPQNTLPINTSPRPFPNETQPQPQASPTQYRIISPQQPVPVPQTHPIIPRNNSTGQLVPGKLPSSKVSPDRLEAQIPQKISSPKLFHTKNINLSNMSSIPITLRSLDDRNIAVGFADGSLKIVDVVDTNISKQYKFNGKVASLETIEDDGKVRLDHGLLCGLGGPENIIVLVDVASPTNNFTKYAAHTDEVTSLVSVGGGKFISGGADGNLFFWKAGVETPTGALVGHSARVNSLALLNNNSTLLSAGDDKVIRSYFIGTGEFIAKNRIVETGPVTMISSFYGNSKFAFSCLSSGAIKIWNIENSR